jgi:hypothetical protein
VSPASISTRSHGHHLERAQEIDRRRRVLAQNHRREHQVPGVFGRILGPRSVHERRPPIDRLQLVGFDEKAHLLIQPVHHCPFDDHVSPV